MKIYKLAFSLLSPRKESVKIPSVPEADKISVPAVGININSVITDSDAKTIFETSQLL